VGDRRGVMPLTLTLSPPPPTPPPLRGGRVGEAGRGDLFCNKEILLFRHRPSRPRLVHPVHRDHVLLEHFRARGLVAAGMRRAPLGRRVHGPRIDRACRVIKSQKPMMAVCGLMAPSRLTGFA
jgi:hypothetical protein